MARVVRLLSWWLWQYSGAFYVYRKLKPAPNSTPDPQPPSSLIVWLIGIYFAFFGFASQRYEALRDRLESRESVISALAGGPGYRAAIAMIPQAQGTLLPPAPSLWPHELWASLSTEARDEEFVDRFRRLVQSRKQSLERAQLSGVDLHSTDMSEASLAWADLRNADLRATDLFEARLEHANLEGADLEGADLRGAMIRSARLYGANLRGVALFHYDRGQPRSLKDGVLADCYCDSFTLLPEGLDPRSVCRAPGTSPDP